MRILSTLPLLLPALALAEPVQIPGPQGPLEAESLAAEGAAHAVIIVPGSGPTDRDGNSSPMALRSDSYRLLAEGLAAEGIASLRVDKRGFYGSAAALADANDVTIANYAQDVRDWVNKASDLAPCVWIAGHSEGGLVALVAAQTPPDSLCGLILMATPGRPIGRLLVEQFAANPMNGPLMLELEGLVADLEAGEARDPALVSPMLQPLFSAGLQRYMIDLFSYDPISLAQGWEGPVLIVQGEADIQVGADHAGLLAAALPQAEVTMLPGATHMLKQDLPGQPFATYTDPALPLHEGLVPAIARFVATDRP
ncbi:alpha/beta hydrolase [Frigidibacter mobilis]|uniref:Alpha/beta hydrolase n=1 Tax=Frigidibacter mobilis TaxID=1335048 RepID=A0A159Z6S3_9RHOB|nr:alpha/beta fold hydrolase [Frigidibacter mobilis]AMY70218.1 alpha/beta hydrolase [Frigidibacter mobilis]